MITHAFTIGCLVAAIFFAMQPSKVLRRFRKRLNDCTECAALHLCAGLALADSVYLVFRGGFVDFLQCFHFLFIYIALTAIGWGVAVVIIRLIVEDD